MSHRTKIKPSIKPKQHRIPNGTKIVKDGFEMVVFNNKEHYAKSQAEYDFFLKKRQEELMLEQIQREEDARNEKFYNSVDCIDLDFYVRMTDYLLYAANYFINESKDILDKHDLAPGSLYKLVNQVADNYVPLYQYMITCQQKNRTFIDNDETMRNRLVELAKRLIDQPRQMSYKLLEGSKLRRQTKTGCDTCRIFNTDSCPFSKNMHEHDQQWMLHNYTCLGRLQQTPNTSNENAQQQSSKAADGQ